MKNLLTCLLITVCVVILIGVKSCAPVFSEMQSAKLVDQGNYEVTPGFTAVDVDGSDQTEMGFQAAYGLSDAADIRLRYVYAKFDDAELKYHVIGAGPKFRIIEDRMAFYVPVGFAFGQDVKESETVAIHPTLLFTMMAGQYVEINPSVKYLYPFDSDSNDLAAFNIGIGFSTDYSRYVIRPEYGWLFDPEGSLSDNYSQFSLGVTVYTNR